LPISHLGITLLPRAEPIPSTTIRLGTCTRPASASA
jgi:hypothetical protein